MVPDPAPTVDTGDWTGPRPRVTGAPVVIGAIVIGLVLVAILASLSNRPGLAAKISQDYSSMAAGLLAAEVQTARPDELAKALAPDGVPFVPKIVALDPDFVLLGGRHHDMEARKGAVWFYKAPSAELAIAHAFEGSLDALGPPDDTRTEGPRPLHVFRKQTQTIVTWQDDAQVYAFTSTLPSEVVLGLAKRLAGGTPPPPAH